MATSAGLAWSLANGISQEQYDKNLVNAYKDAVSKGLTDAQIESGMNQWGISAADVARATGVTPASVQARLDAATPTTAAEIAYDKAAMDELAVREAQNQTQIKANQTAYAEQQRLNELANQQQIGTNQKAYEGYLANQARLAGPSQGFAQNFANYQAIAPGAQFDPSVTGGASPYSLIMGQMKPFSNPYANMPVNTPLGGYNPALYEQINAANLAKAEAAKLAGVNTIIESGGDGGDSGSGGDGNTGGGPGTGADGDAAFAKGGMVRSLLGPDPQGPDDGMGYLDKGEYVIKKSSVDKYGRGLLDMINEGKVPAKKMKSLLG
jgi:hypothetical protein